MELDNVPQDKRKLIIVEQKQGIFHESQKNIAAKNYSPENGLNMHLDFLFPVPQTYRQVFLYYGIIKKNNNFVIDDYSCPAIKIDLSYKRKVVLQEKEYI